MRTIVFLMLMVSFVTGCASSAKHADGTIRLENEHWVLTTLRGRPAIEDGSARQSFLELQPQQVRFVGNTGLNAVSGTYTKTSQSLRFSIEACTRATGSDEAVIQERDLLTVLAATQTYQLHGRELSLMVDDQVAALFVAK